MGGLGLFLLPGGLPLGLGAGCACFIGFFNLQLASPALAKNGSAWPLLFFVGPYKIG